MCEVGTCRVDDTRLGRSHTTQLLWMLGDEPHTAKWTLSRTVCNHVAWTYKHTHRQTGRQTYRQKGRQTDRQTDRQTNRQTDRSTHRQNHARGLDGSTASSAPLRMCVCVCVCTVSLAVSRRAQCTSVHHAIRRGALQIHLRQQTFAS